MVKIINGEIVQDSQVPPQYSANQQAVPPPSFQLRPRGFDWSNFEQTVSIFGKRVLWRTILIIGAAIGFLLGIQALILFAVIIYFGFKDERPANS